MPTARVVEWAEDQAIISFGFYEAGSVAEKSRGQMGTGQI